MKRKLYDVFKENNCWKVQLENGRIIVATKELAERYTKTSQNQF